MLGVEVLGWVPSRFAAGPRARPPNQAGLSPLVVWSIKKRGRRPAGDAAGGPDPSPRHDESPLHTGPVGETPAPSITSRMCAQTQIGHGPQTRPSLMSGCDVQ
jgi:hypothetical protein